MLFTIYVKDTGMVRYSGWANEELSITAPGEAILVGAEYIGGWIDSNNEHHTMPPQPSENHTFNWQAKQWEDLRTLADFKVAQWALIKQSRSTAEYAGFTYDGSIFDSDSTSQVRVTGAVTLALVAKQANQPYEITWTLKDSTLRTLSADEMVAVGLALGTHVQTCFNKGQMLQQQINAATTKEVVEAIVW